MIDIAAIKAACGLIVIKTPLGRKGRGTGYLVNRDQLVTCAHVVGQIKEFTVEINGNDHEASVARIDPDADCALLVLRQPLLGVEPLRLTGRCRWKAPWDGYGFPDVANGAGIPLEGAVRDPAGTDDLKAPVLILASPEVAAGMATPIHGFSGSPVLVEGAVVGHLKRIIPDRDTKDPVMKDTDKLPRAAFGYVYATPSSEVLKLMGASPDEHDPVLTHLKNSAEQRNQLEDVPTAIENLAAVKAVSRARVLWVDDHPDGNMIEHLMLRDLGMYITSTLSTETARIYLQQGEFDLVITDLARGLDKKAGLKLIEALRIDGSNLPVIVYTLKPGEREASALALGATAVTTTPASLLTAVLKVVSENDKAQWP